MAGGFSKNQENTSKELDIEEARQKIARFCSYQERAHSEVEMKLYSYGLRRGEVEELLAWLITENFVNEERFAVAFAGGKFRVKRWGRNKIRQYLEIKKVSAYSIEKALQEIDPNDYLKALDFLIEKAVRATKAPNIFELRHKIARSLIAKGYEPELVWERLKFFIKDEIF